ncbi:MAG: TRAP transporter permease [Lentisphaeria bacterium]|nr:TRAP transporter permease [Lentisphaeria bacterium]NQZ68869.1 TRAP transporter permease [Lentisphaeria bacterium]
MSDTNEKLLVTAEEFESANQRQDVFFKWAVGSVAVCWTLFQLYHAISGFWKFPTIRSDTLRSAHLTFAIVIVFWGYLPLKSVPSFLSFLKKIPNGILILSSVDFILGLLAAYSASYYGINYERISEQLDPTKMDIAVGILLIVCLLEGARRVIGPSLSVLCLVFVAYAFFGDRMPTILSVRVPSLTSFVQTMTLGTEGIYGVPIKVSANTVFLFVLFGAMLERAGAGRFFIELALSLLGGFKGGPAKAAVLGSGLTGMVSGSSIANIVTTGTFTIPLMKKVGYPPEKAAAIEVAASTDGQIAPPIMGAAAFLIAEFANGVGYAAVVKAAIVPAFVSYCTLFFITHIEASKLGLRRIPRSELPLFWKVFKGGVHYLIPVAVLIHCLFVIRLSPNLSAFCGIIALVLIIITQPFFNDKDSDNRQKLKRGLVDLTIASINGAKNMVVVALATAAAGIIVGVISLGLGGKIGEVIKVLSMNNLYLMLAITAIASLIVGMGLPTTATYIVTATLVAGTISTIGEAQGLMIPLLGAHLFCFYFGILADDTPPVGLAAYAAAAISGSKPVPTGIQAFLYDIRTAILPFMFILNPDIILHNITSWSQGALIFCMTCMGSFAFAAATQRYWIAKNKWADFLLLILATFILFRPDFFASIFQVDRSQRYWFYIPGLIVFGFVYFLQLKRGNGEDTENTEAVTN